MICRRDQVKTEVFLRSKLLKMRIFLLTKTNKIQVKIMLKIGIIVQFYYLQNMRNCKSYFNQILSKIKSLIIISIYIILETQMFPRNLPSFFAARIRAALSTVKSEIIYDEQDQRICDFQRLDSGKSNIQCLVIVNNRLNQVWLEKALNCCDHIVLADGGANQFYKTPFRDTNKVSAIVGDFDSLKPEVRSFYERKGVELQQVWNQDTNDFEKAVKKAISRGWNKIFCFGAFGGRMDHTLSSMHNAQKLSLQHKDLSICLFGQTNLMYYLRGNIKHKIILSESLQRNFCGLIPFGKAEAVETKGLKWNIGTNFEHKSLKWGDFISTSNCVEGDVVEVESSEGIFFVSHFRSSQIE